MYQQSLRWWIQLKCVPLYYQPFYSSNICDVVVCTLKASCVSFSCQPFQCVLFNSTSVEPNPVHEFRILSFCGFGMIMNLGFFRRVQNTLFSECMPEIGLFEVRSSGWLFWRGSKQFDVQVLQVPMSLKFDLLSTMKGFAVCYTYLDLIQHLTLLAVLKQNTTYIT